MDEYELKELISFLVSQQKKNTIYDSSDLFQEAMMVVPIALSTWDSKRNAALKTYIRTCIVNRFKDLQKSQYTRPEDLAADKDEIANLAIPDDPISAFEFDLTMKQILTPFEFAVYRKHYVYGYTTRDIRSIFTISSMRLDSCLRSICAKFQSLEESLQKITTQRRLSENFLCTSEQRL